MDAEQGISQFFLEARPDISGPRIQFPAAHSVILELRTPPPNTVVCHQLTAQLANRLAVARNADKDRADRVHLPVELANEIGGLTNRLCACGQHQQECPERAALAKRSSRLAAQGRCALKPIQEVIGVCHQRQHPTQSAGLAVVALGKDGLLPNETSELCEVRFIDRPERFGQGGVQVKIASLGDGPRTQVPLEGRHGPTTQVLQQLL